LVEIDIVDNNNKIIRKTLEIFAGLLKKIARF
jgi:hypothetical protein